MSEKSIRRRYKVRFAIVARFDLGPPQPPELGPVAIRIQDQHDVVGQRKNGNEGGQQHWEEIYKKYINTSVVEQGCVAHTFAPTSLV